MVAGQNKREKGRGAGPCREPPVLCRERHAGVTDGAARAAPQLMKCQGAPSRKGPRRSGWIGGWRWEAGGLCMDAAAYLLSQPGWLAPLLLLPLLPPRVGAVLLYASCSMMASKSRVPRSAFVRGRCPLGASAE